MVSINDEELEGLDLTLNSDSKQKVLIQVSQEKHQAALSSLITLGKLFDYLRTEHKVKISRDLERKIQDPLRRVLKSVKEPKTRKVDPNKVMPFQMEKTATEGCIRLYKLLKEENKDLDSSLGLVFEGVGMKGKTCRTDCVKMLHSYIKNNIKKGQTMNEFELDQFCESLFKPEDLAKIYEKNNKGKQIVTNQVTILASHLLED